MSKRRNTLKRLFIDIETAPNIVYSWRLGYNVTLFPENLIKERAVICIAWQWEGEKEVGALAWKDGDDKDMLQKFASILAQADEVVGHNIDKFDLPWIRARAAKNGVDLSAILKTVDTLKIARRYFNFNSNRLDYLAQFLGIGAKIKTEFEWWADVMNGNKTRLKQMVQYCQRDVTILVKVFHKLQSYIPVATHAGVVSGGVRSDCPQCASKFVQKRGSRVSITGIRKQIMSCNDCGRNFTVTQNVAREK
jgi:hypothetical protein